MSLLDRLAAIVGPANLLTGADCAPYARDWMGDYAWTPLAVVQAIVGHSNPAMTRNYFHESAEALQSAVAALPDAARHYGYGGILFLQAAANWAAGTRKAFLIEQDASLA